MRSLLDARFRNIQLQHAQLLVWYEPSALLADALGCETSSSGPGKLRFPDVQKREQAGITADDVDRSKCTLTGTVSL